MTKPCNWKILYGNNYMYIISYNVDINFNIRE